MDNIIGCSGLHIASCMENKSGRSSYLPASHLAACAWSSMVYSYAAGLPGVSTAVEQLQGQCIDNIRDLYLLHCDMNLLV